MNIFDKLNFCITNLNKAELFIHSPSEYFDMWTVVLKGKSIENDEINLRTTDKSLEEAITSMYLKAAAFVNNLPDFDANKTIAPPPVPATPDEIPY